VASVEVRVASGTVVVYSDIGCPWAHAAVWRLWDARRSLGLDERVRFDHHAFPLELFNSEPTPRNELEPEIPVCSALAPRAGWQAWSGPDWAYPVTMLPAMEAVQAAKQQGLAASEALDRGLRRAFWGESRCVSLRHVILEVASETDAIDLAALASALDTGIARGMLFQDWEVAKSDAVQGSPHLFAPDGTNAQNPGLDVDWKEQPDGVWLPTILRDDPAAYEDLLRRAVG
jgi:predicted DsbA family dithiol-disulfide isomerase